MAQDAEKSVAQRRRLADGVFDRLNRAIKSGAYGADERLPTESELLAGVEVPDPQLVALVAGEVHGVGKQAMVLRDGHLTDGDKAGWARRSA